MAHSEFPAVIEAELPIGAALTTSGRVSAATEDVHLPYELPFSNQQRLLLDNTLTEAIRSTGIRFTVYIGDLGADPAAGVDALFPGTPDAEHSVLIAVSPNHRAVEIRSGKAVAPRADDKVLQLGVTAAVSAFKQGDLLDGLTAAVRVMAAAVAQ